MKKRGANGPFCMIRDATLFGGGHPACAWRPLPDQGLQLASPGTSRSAMSQLPTSSPRPTAGSGGPVGNFGSSARDVRALQDVGRRRRARHRTSGLGGFGQRNRSWVVWGSFMYRMMDFSQPLFDLFDSSHKCLTRKRFRRPFYCNPGRPQTGKPSQNERSHASIRRSLIRIMARIKSCSPIFDAATTDWLLGRSGPHHFKNNSFRDRKEYAMSLQPSPSHGPANGVENGIRTSRSALCNQRSGTAHLPGRPWNTTMVSTTTPTWST